MGSYIISYSSKWISLRCVSRTGTYSIRCKVFNLFKYVEEEFKEKKYASILGFACDQMLYKDRLAYVNPSMWVFRSSAWLLIRTYQERARSSEQ